MLNDDYLLDFNQILVKETQSNAWPYVEFSIGYAVAYIHSETSRSDLVMKIGSDDQAKVYLNGREIYRHSYARRYSANQDTVSNLELHAGLNVLVLKVVNEGMNWQGSIWLTDVEGEPVPGITVTLDPDFQPANASGAR